MKILIADDEFLIRKALTVRLEKGNYQFDDIYYAENGAEAFELIQEHHPDIVITDVLMENMTGLDLIKRCRRKGIQTSFIVISGYAEFEYVQTAIEHGICGYLLKPITQKKLFETMDRAICECRERELFINTLRENDCLLLNDLISKCKKNTISTEEYEQLLKLLHVDKHCEFIAATAHITTYRQDRFLDPEDVYQALEPSLTKQISVSFKILHTEKIQNRLILFYGNHLAENAAMIEKALRSILQRQKTLGTILTIGLGKPNNQIDAALLLSSEHALNQRFKKGNGDVYSRRTIRESEDISQIFDLKSFELSIKNKGGYEAAAEFEKLLDQLYLHIYNLNFLIQYIYELLIRMNFRPDREFWTNYMENKYWMICENKEEVLEPIRQELKRTCSLTPHPKPSLTEQIKNFIHCHCNEYLSLSLLGDKYHMNPKYLSSVFKKQEGISPIDYLLQVRIEKAKQLLQSSELSAAEIASMVGYEDPRYFYKVFKKKTGITPKEYRERKE